MCDQSRTLYIEGLNPDVTSLELQEFFRRFGEIERVQRDAVTDCAILQFALAHVVGMISKGRILFDDKVAENDGPSRLKLVAVKDAIKDLRRTFNCCFLNLSDHYKKDGFVDEDLEDATYYTHPEVINVHPLLPEAGHYLAIVDASTSGHLFGFGSAIIDSKGAEVLFFYGNRTKNIKSMEYKEGFAVHRLLQRIKLRDYCPGLTITSDNQHMIDLINKNIITENEQLKNLISKIKKLAHNLQDNSFSINFVWSCRETTYVGDRLSRMGLKLDKDDEVLTPKCDDWTVLEFLKRGKGGGFFKSDKKKGRRTFLELNNNFPLVDAGSSSTHVLLRNMYDFGLDNFSELEKSLPKECKNSCLVRRLHFYKGSEGVICVEFLKLSAAIKFQSKMCSRWYNHRLIEAVFIDTTWPRCQLKKNLSSMASKSFTLQMESQLLKIYIFEVSSLVATLESNRIWNLMAVGLLTGPDGVLEGPDCIFVSGLPYTSTTADIKMFLESIGPLRALQLVKERDTQNFKGVVFCVYHNLLHTDLACATLNGFSTNITNLTVKRAYQGIIQPEQEKVLVPRIWLQLEKFEYQPAQTHPDIFGTTEEVSNAVKAEIEKNKEEQPKQVIWDGHTGSIVRTANQAVSQSLDDQMESGNSLPGPVAPSPKPGVPPVCSGLYMQPRPPMMQMMLGVRPPPMSMNLAQQSMMMNRPPQHTRPVSMNIPVPPTLGSQFTPLGMPRPFTHLPPPAMQLMPPPSMHHGMHPPPPPEEAPPLPEEPEPKRQKVEDQLIPEEQFLARHPGPIRIAVAIPNVDELKLRGRLSEITVQSLSETIGNLKEKIFGETQIAPHNQKLSGRAGFFEDNLSLAYYNIGAGETLTLALRDRLQIKMKYPGSGRKR